MTDPISDLITRLRNGQTSGLAFVSSPYSKLKESVLNVLHREGYIVKYTIEINEDNRKSLVIELKYYKSKPVISEIKRISKPGRRVFSKILLLNKFFNGLGVYIISTPKGVLSDNEARSENVGGEVLISVY
jgi:small subunit ribosomal protein S8